MIFIILFKLFYINIKLNNQFIKYINREIPAALFNLNKKFQFNSLIYYINI